MAAIVVIAAGCSQGPFDMVRVEGTVRYSDGTEIPAPRVVITFHPQDPPASPKIQPRPGQAVATQPSGAFDVVTSHKYDDGIVAGAHKVTVVAQGENWRQLKGLVPPEYARVDTTPIRVDSSDSPFEFRIDRPTN